MEIDRMAKVLAESAGDIPAFLGYKPEGSKPYPASICISINDEVVHGIPSDKKSLKMATLSRLIWDSNIVD